MIIIASILIVVAIVGIYYFFFRPTNIVKLLNDYWEQTKCLSVPSDIRKTSTFKRIIEVGKEVAVPAIIEDIRHGGGRLALYVLLWDLTGVRPNHPLQEDGFIKFDIKAEGKAWIRWAEKQGI